VKHELMRSNNVCWCLAVQCNRWSDTWTYRAIARFYLFIIQNMRLCKDILRKTMTRCTIEQ